MGGPSRGEIIGGHRYHISYVWSEGTILIEY